MRNRSYKPSMIEPLESRRMLSDNTFATAHTLGNTKGFGGTSTANDAITSTDTIDIFRIFTAAKGNLRVDLKGITAVLKMTLVQDKNGNGAEDAGEQLRTVNAIAGIGGSISVATSRRLPIDTFFIKLERATAFDTNYRLEVSYDTAGSTLATARGISDANGAFGRHDLSEGVNLSTGDGIDFFSFTLDPRVSSARFAAEVIAPAFPLYHIDIFRDSNNNLVIDAGEFLTTFESFGGPITLTAGARYFLRVVRSTPSTENYTLRTQFDYAGNSISQARNINGIDDVIQNFRDQVSNLPNAIATDDFSDFYRFNINVPQDVCFQIVMSDASPATTQLTATVIRDTNNNGGVDAGEELATSITSISGVATLNFPLSTAGAYFLKISGGPTSNYSLAISGDRTPGIIPSNRYSNSRDIGTVTSLRFQTGALGPTDGALGDPSDTFKLTLPLAGKLKTNTNSTLINGRLDFDSDKDGIVDPGEQLAVFNRTTPLDKELAAGTYFVTVTGQTGTYDLFLIPDFAGDTPAKARQLGSLGTFFQADDRIAPLDPDFYRFSLASSQNLTVNLFGFENVSPVDVILFQENSDTLTELTRASGAGSQKNLLRSLPAGTYLVEVLTTGPTQENYSVGFSTGDNDDSIPEVLLTPNHVVTVGDSRDFTIDSVSDVDILRVSFEDIPDTAFAVDIDSRNGSNFDTFIRLFDQAGNQLASNDDGAAPGELSSKFSFLTFVLPDDLTGLSVFVGVSSAQNKNYNPLTGGGDSGGSTTGQYTIHILPFTPPAGWIGGFVYNDLDGDGVKDSNETGIAGRTVFIDLDNDSALDANEKRTTTDASGQYIFTGLAAGTYKVRQVRPAGWTQTSPLNNFGLNVMITTGQHSTANHFFIRPTPMGIGSIGGLVFHDLDRDGVKDINEGGLSALTVYLDLDNDSILDTNEQRVITNSSGDYAFASLGAGTYKVRIALHSGFVQTFPTNNFGNNVTLTAGQNVIDKNFGAHN